MLKTYLVSVIIWMMINYSMIVMFGDKIKSNGWIDRHEASIGKLKILFVISVVPFVRFLILSCLIYMTIYTQAQYDGRMEEINDDMEE